jgi:hypothetical protein
VNEPEVKMLSGIAVKVGNLEALEGSSERSVNDMAQSDTRLVYKLDKSDDISHEALQSSKWAHHRLIKIGWD